MDHRRIIARLRSRHHPVDPRKRRKQPPAVSLDLAIHHPSIRVGPCLSQARISELRYLARRFHDTFQSLEDLPDPISNMAANKVQDILVDLILQARNLCTVPDLEATLNSYPKMFPPSIRQYLPDVLNKLSNYYNVAIRLIDAAQTNDTFEHIRIEIVHQPAFDATYLTQNQPSFEEVYHQAIGTRSVTTATLTPERLAEARKQYSILTQGLPAQYKVHAEIQLVHFYDSHPQISPQPRLLVSSKCSCYLCHLFITLHGRFQVPRTHGTLYAKWVLPEWPLSSAWNETVQKTASEMDAAVKRRAREVLARERMKTVYVNESVVDLDPYNSDEGTIVTDVEPALNGGGCASQTDTGHLSN